MNHTDPDRRLKEWATPTQAKYLDAVGEHGSQRAAADALGVAHGTLSNALAGLRKKAARLGYAPGHFKDGVAPGYLMGKVTVQRDAGGGVERTWERQSPDAEALAVARQSILDALGEEVRGMSPLVAAPEHVYADLLAVYPWGDPHVGLYVWAKECGDAFDLVEAERLTLGAVDRLVSSAPAAETAIILPLGDFFHANDQSNQTPAHRHQLDVDSRYPKVLEIGIKTLRHAVLRALEKHAKVIVRIEPGNHDPEAKWALAFTISAYFENEPRVEVDLTPGKFWYYKFGKVLIGSTHGDTVKHAQLNGVMSTDRPKDWGDTIFRYFYTGHVHSSNVTELPGVTCESFRTLAAADAYTVGHGYRAGRDMRCVVHHREHGEVERHRCDVSMVG